MARIASFRDLTVWQKAMDLAVLCYEMTADFPDGERFGLTRQVRKSGVSIPSNVAEGHNRRSREAYRNHVGIALGSQAELETQLELAKRLHFGRAERLDVGLQLAGEVGRMLHALVLSLEKTTPRQ